jgi:hypothetical protein
MMGEVPAALLIVFAVVMIAIVGGVFPGPIIALIRRRVPNFSYEGAVFMLWGLLISTAFAFGLVMMYLLMTLH